MATPAGVVRSAIDSFADGIVDAIPELAAGLIFLTLAYLGIIVITASLYRRGYPD